jgi:hypothetical protein
MQLGRASSLAVLFLLGSICGTKADSRIETGGNYVRIYITVNTEPANIMAYKQDAFKEIIPENDPVFAEIIISRQARRFGVDTAEMRKREQLALGCEHLSSDTKRYFVCIDAIDWGLSEPIYHKRRSRLSDCKLSNEDQEVLDAIPKRLRFDHPLFIRRETCERNVMLDQ